MSIRTLPTNLQKLAEAELNEVSGRIEADILSIRKWLKHQPHLNAKLDDQWILTFLRGCKFSLEKTKQKLESFYTFRTLAPELFRNRDPLLPEIQEILECGCYWMPLPKPKSEDIPRVLYLTTEGLGNDNVKICNAMKVNLMILDILMNEEDNFIIAGHQLFHSLKGIKMYHITQITPSLLKKFASCMRDAYPLRPKQIHFIDLPNSTEMLIRPFFTGKHSQRIKIYNKSCLENLHEELPKSILPTELGGEAGPLKNMQNEWKRKIESYREWFLNDEQYCSDESKRIGTPKTVGDVFGIEGSFRKLDFD